MRAHNFKDISGQRFGMLTALRVSAVTTQTKWLCLCDCGQETVKTYQHIVDGRTRSCGCFRRKVSADTLRKKQTSHGMSYHPQFQRWSGMMDRCYNTRSKRYKDYGGRGITVCDRWHNPANFIADMGAAPEGSTLDRIDNDKGYSPDNCRWATVKEQNNNRRSTRLVSFGGQVKSISAWADIAGVSKATMKWRLDHWPTEKALSTPPLR